MNVVSTNPRRYVYALLIVVAAGMVAGKILSTHRVYEPSMARDPNNPQDRRTLWPATRPRPMPTFSSNDRSRWATIRALVDDGTYVVGRRDQSLVLASAASPLGAANPLEAAFLHQAAYQLRIKSDQGIVFEDGWQTVDKVLHPAKLEFYSSKPPLLSTLVAGLYWWLQFLFGWKLADHPNQVVRTILMLVNWLPFLIYLVLLARLVERYGRTDWGRFYVFAAGCFATFLTPFAITLNNHNIGTYCILFALYAVLHIWERENREQWERQQQAFAPRPSVLTFTPASYVAAGFFAGFAVCNELPAAAFAAALFLILLWLAPGRTLLYYLPALALPLAALAFTNYLAVGQLRPAYSEFGGPWYTYEGSHWRPPNPGQTKRGIDWAHLKESRAIYAVHVLVGHHGLFSLSPIWILAMIGMVAGVRRTFSGRSPPANVEAGPVLPRFLLPLSLFLTIVVVGFYLVKSDNYGGFTSGLRWLMWLTPLWLLCLLPVADHLANCRWGRLLGYILLGFSVLSVSYPAWNPWRHPWLFDLMETLGWPGY